MRIVRGCPAGESRGRAGCGTPRAGAGDPVGLRLARAGHDCNFVTRPRARPRAHVSDAFPRRASPLSANRTVNQSRRPWERRPPRASRPAHDAPGTSAQPTDLPPRHEGVGRVFVAMSSEPSPVLDDQRRLGVVPSFEASFFTPGDN